MRFEEIRVTDYAVQLPPETTAGMAVGAEIAPSHPAIIGARFLGTVLGLGVDRARAPALRDDQRRRGRQWRADGRLGLLAGRAGWACGQTNKRVEGFWSSGGPPGRRLAP